MKGARLRVAALLACLGALLFAAHGLVGMRLMVALGATPQQESDITLAVALAVLALMLPFHVALPAYLARRHSPWRLVALCSVGIVLAQGALAYPAWTPGVEGLLLGGRAIATAAYFLALLAARRRENVLERLEGPLATCLFVLPAGHLAASVLKWWCGVRIQEQGLYEFLHGTAGLSLVCVEMTLVVLNAVVLMAFLIQVRCHADESVRTPVRSFLSFGGRFRCRDFWTVQFAALPFLLFAAHPLLLEHAEAREFAFFRESVPLLAVLGVAFLPMCARRLHDRGRSARLLFLLLPFQAVPFVGCVVPVVYCLPGTRGPNRFGPDPRVAHLLGTDDKGPVVAPSSWSSGAVTLEQEAPNGPPPPPPRVGGMRLE